MIFKRSSLALALLAAGFSALAAANTPPEPVDPLTARIEISDVERFAEIFAESGGTPSAEQLQEHYLDKGTYGVEVFTEGRIGDAARLARQVAKNQDDYRDALERCLPQVKAANADLRSIYLGLAGAIREARLPQVYIVMGAGNSGGTAGPDAQVLGLEVICRISEDDESLRKMLRHFFAHETVHALQMRADEEPDGDELLRSVLVEGAADFIARLVTGAEPDLARAEWALPREDELLEQLLQDFDTVRDGSEDAEKARRRWVGNFGSPPEGWPGELGYWMGMRIWERYWAASPDKRAALQRMLTLENPREVLTITQTESAQ